MRAWGEVARGLEQLVARARSKQRQLGMSIGLHEPAIVEIVDGFGFDWILLDREHTMLGENAALIEMIRAAEATRLPLFVKLNTWDPIAARDALDLGAHGLMIPFV